MVLKLLLSSIILFGCSKNDDVEMKTETNDIEMLEMDQSIEENKKNKEKPLLEAVVKAKMPLSGSYMAKLKDMGNSSSSYFYTLTIVHLLHILVTLLYLISMIIMVSRKELTADNQLKIKLGGYFWHFFAGLWVYLLLFLFLIH